MMHAPRVYTLLAVLLFGISSALFAEKHISGDISGLLFSVNNNPYIVDKDIEIPEGSSVTIPAGCVFLFSPFSGIVVKGAILVSGTEQEPVVFTSINNETYNSSTEQMANPFDWNGIHISKAKSSARFENTQLSYSVYGIKSESSEIAIINSTFQHNGQYHFTISDGSAPRIVPIQDNIAFTCKDGKECLYLASGTSGGAVPISAKPPKANVAKITTTSLAATFAVGAVAAGILQSIKAEAQFDSAGMAFVDGSRNDKYYSRYKKYYKQSMAAFAGSGVCFGAAIYFYYFHFKKLSNQQALLLPQIHTDGTFGVTMDLRW